MNYKTVAENIFNNILSGEVFDVKTFIENHISTKPIPLPHDTNFRKIEMKKGENVNVVTNYLDTVKTLNILADIINKSEDIYLEIEYDNNAKEEDSILFWPFSESYKSVMSDSYISESFRKIFGNDYHKARISPFKKELKALIKRDFLTKEEYDAIKKAKSSKRLSVITIIISLLVGINSIWPLVKTKKSNEIKIINSLSTSDTLKVQIINSADTISTITDSLKKVEKSLK